MRWSSKKVAMNGMNLGKPLLFDPHGDKAPHCRRNKFCDDWTGGVILAVDDDEYSDGKKGGRQNLRTSKIILSLAQSSFLTKLYCE
jgi:hypothetical protein